MNERYEGLLSEKCGLVLGENGDLMSWPYKYVQLGLWTEDRFKKWQLHMQDPAKYPYEGSVESHIPLDEGRVRNVTFIKDGDDFFVKVEDVVDFIKQLAQNMNNSSD